VQCLNFEIKPTADQITQNGNIKIKAAGFIINIEVCNPTRTKSNVGFNHDSKSITGRLAQKSGFET